LHRVVAAGQPQGVPLGLVEVAGWAATDAVTAGADAAAKQGTAIAPKQAAAMAVAMTRLVRRAVMWLFIIFS
jgi:hypothetical protein